MFVQNEIAQKITEIILTLPFNKAEQVLDFARWMQTRVPDTDIAPEFLQATPEELAKEDSAWDRAVAADPDKLARLADAALEAHQKGLTTMVNDDGDELQPTSAARL